MNRKYNSRKIIEYASYLNDEVDFNNVGEYYVEQIESIEEDIYNMVIFLLTMCINKELTLRMNNDTIPVEKYPDELKKIHSIVSEKYRFLNSQVISKLKQNNLADVYIFSDYLDRILNTLLSGIKYIEKNKDEEWNYCDQFNAQNTQYNREERIRDYMEQIVFVDKTFAQFTMKYKIEVPCMYVLAWDLQNLVNNYDKDRSIYGKKSYMAGLRRKISNTLRLVSDNSREILIAGNQVDEEKYEEHNENACIMYMKNICYIDLLPTIVYSENVSKSEIDDLQSPGSWAKARKTHIVPLIKKEVLQKKPLVPMEIKKELCESKTSLKLLMDLLVEENQTKDYLKSDITKFSDTVAKICFTLLGWLGREDGYELRLPLEYTKHYLNKIMNAVQYLPRKDTENNYQEFLKNVANEIALAWDSKNLSVHSFSPVNKEWNTYLEYAYASVLKLSRNWNFHKLMSDPSIGFVTFLFMISLRYVFIVEENKMDDILLSSYRGMEAELFNFLSKEKVPYNKSILEELKKKYEKIYNCILEYSGDNKKPPAYIPDKVSDIDSHKVLSVAGHKKSKINNFVSENDIFFTFWITVHFGSELTKDSLDNIRDLEDPNIKYILERTYKYINKSQFLSLSVKER